MNRRTFLKQVGALAVTFAVPEPLTEAFAHLSEVPTGNVTIDLATKTIHINNASASMTVLEFHRYLQDIWDEPEMMDVENPSNWITSSHIRLVNGWRVNNDSLNYLRDGSLQQNVDEYYLSYYTSIDTRGNR